LRSSELGWKIEGTHIGGAKCAEAEELHQIAALRQCKFGIAGFHFDEAARVVRPFAAIDTARPGGWGAVAKRPLI